MGYRKSTDGQPMGGNGTRDPICKSTGGAALPWDTFFDTLMLFLYWTNWPNAAIMRGQPDAIERLSSEL